MSSFFTARDLASLRDVAESTQTVGAQLSRKTLVDDTMGGKTETWATVATTTCRVALSGQTPQEKAIADRLASITLYTLSMPVGTDARAADRIAVGGRTFEVVSPLPQTDGVRLRIICKEIV